jgi:hypothetical protein
MFSSVAMRRRFARLDLLNEFRAQASDEQTGGIGVAVGIVLGKLFFP